MMQTVKVTVLIFVGSVVLNACGLRGPLYLPDEGPDAKPVSETEATTEAEEEVNGIDGKEQKPDSG